ncbi:VanZ family protein [Candidatus Woesearchaeota archaeon]|nr:VanZ family protein [Candidatus Woesearchaeota archaeon]
MDKKFLLWYLLPLVLYAGAILYSSTISDFPTIRGVVSQQPVPQGAWTGDDIEHIITYALLALLFYRMIMQSSWSSFSVAATVLFCFVFGFSNEIIQSFTPERSFSVMDMFWNMAGTLILKIL